MSSPFEALLKLKSALPSNKKDPKGKKALASLEPQKAPASLEPGELCDSDAILFLKEMDGVEPLGMESKRIEPVPPDPEKFLNKDTYNEELEVMNHLRDLVAGNIDFDISFTDEYIEGYVKGLPPSTREDLKNGRYPIQDQLDLHGRNLEEARKDLKNFLVRASGEGKRSVLVIHGRGLRSPDGFPVIKSNLHNLLLKNPLRQYILAFTTAIPSDGGFGAIYVLLRRNWRTKRM
ncbi:MAG: Smr/MutS family protein [Deltaproteobacteria bacterium]|jgi:DNA-nicking Smr family endonuclease|nr:Smr/MutS family protein [Deltaproteobacteria bacterium]